MGFLNEQGLKNCSLVKDSVTFHMQKACTQGNFLLEPKKFSKLPVVNFTSELHFTSHCEIENENIP